MHDATSTGTGFLAHTVRFRACRLQHVWWTQHSTAQHNTAQHMSLRYTVANNEGGKSWGEGGLRGLQVLGGARGEVQLCGVTHKVNGSMVE